MKISIWHTGLVRVDEATPFRNSSRLPLGLGRGREHQVVLPVSSYLIEHPNGPILVDAGWSQNVRRHPVQELGLTRFAAKPVLPAGWSVTEHLQRRGIQTSDLNSVLMSHLDTDHVSGLLDVNPTRPVYVSGRELAAGNDRFNPRYVKRMWAGLQMTAIPYQRTHHGPLGWSWDLFNDGRIELILTPGHSTGLMTVKVTGDDGHYVLLASDVGYDQLNLTKLILPGILTSATQEMAALGWVQACAADPRCDRVIFNHDRQVREGVLTV
ncbi:N-acyl homoserine lactonase family protein [Levilactobacillus cerevisiae]|uniref:N-acyl homoserine lactonase family protein n=1 Tax=Levilactobacillus cerevisiae TaxID=1704076 RepID=UPI000F78A1B6|nr:N-acyl homoserine lactonase family protein [Levilactobacillus cerevisiae]